MKKISLLYLILLVSFTTQPLFAETGGYLIEVLVFSQNLPTKENFDQTESKIQWPSALTELSAYPIADFITLKTGAAELFKDFTYQPIAQFAWIQSTSGGNTTLPVHLESSDGKLNGYMHFRTIPPYELITDFELRSSQKNTAGKHYLYRLNEKRALKLNEIQYLDHPKFGVLVSVKRIGV